MPAFITSDISATGSAITVSTSPALVDGEAMFITQGTTVSSSSSRAILSNQNIITYTWTNAGNMLGETGA